MGGWLLTVGYAVLLIAVMFTTAQGEDWKP